MKPSVFEYLRMTMLSLTAAVWLYHCAPPTVGDLGGSEVVVGKLERVDRAPVGDAEVLALLITDVDPSEAVQLDTDTVAQTTSDATGLFKFKFEEGEQREFFLDASYKEDSLLLAQSVKFNPNPLKQVDLGILVMKAPGAISGTVIRDGIGPDEVIDCYIAGTSYAAKINSNTPDFTISNLIPDTSYEVTISSHGYKPVTIPDVAVKPGETTPLPDTIRLELDPKNAPAVAPAGLSIIYDTLTGIARLAWQPVPIEDVRRYHVYSTSTCGLLGDPVTVNETMATVSIFSGGDDSIKTVCFQVAAYDDENMEGPLGKVETLVAVPPSWLKVNISLAKVENRGTADSVYVAMSFSSKIRSIDTIAWRADDSVLKTTGGIGAKSGTDTILWVISANANRSRIYVRLTDNADSAWIDSLDARQLLPIKAWKLLPDSLNVARRYAGACAVGGKIYVFGGCKELETTTPNNYWLSGLKTAEMYDPVIGQWAAIPPMKFARYRAAYAAVDGKIYVFGGTTGTTDLASVERYDTVSKTWDTVGTMKQPLVGASACAVNGIIYITGGAFMLDGQLVRQKTIVTYNPANGNWDSAGVLQIPRDLHQTVAVGNAIITLGGLRDDEDGFGFQLNDVECLAPPGGDACGIAEMSLASPRYRFGAAVVNEQLVLIGGLVETDGTKLQPVKTVEVFSLKAPFTHESGEDMPVAREGSAAVTVNGCIYVIGGSASDQDNQKSTRSVYVYYP